MSDSHDPLTDPKHADRLTESTAMRPAPTRGTKPKEAEPRLAIRQTSGDRLWFKAPGAEPRRGPGGDKIMGYHDEWTASGEEAASLSMREAKLYCRESHGPEWRHIKIFPHPAGGESC